ncbi:hypothetical protein EV191_112110 [Tamaricihabitans halophyticus]|uniref:NAD(P)-binding domain-containing protein n=1 Tax=Tamaricihabitans halophyticus TaxID=1262583 RepID=A0A4R2QFM4_9PSEU|nr:NAD(P)H-binding protein [Tamaricihabitans halophyticus]TCP47314.1 hypothetical protein EV191_112110 [Tamaricihabitans halophyticus]
MNITIIGATGMVGSRLVSEAAVRGHRVTATARTPASYADSTIVARAVDARVSTQVDTALSEADSVVLTVRAAAGQEHSIVAVTASLLDAVERRQLPLLVIGGAGALRSPQHGDKLVIDDPDYVPAEVRDIASASLEQLNTCVEHSYRNWVYLSPPANLAPGNRTGTYRRGTTTLLTAPDGTSRISAEDLAIAAIDEIERPSGEQHITVAAGNVGAQ